MVWNEYFTLPCSRLLGSWLQSICTYGKKRGRTKWKQYQTKRPTESQVRKMFGGDKKNIAIVMGGVSNAVVRDFDETGKYRDWASHHAELASTAPTVATASGFHVYVTMDQIPRLRVSGVGSGKCDRCEQKNRPFRYCVFYKSDYQNCLLERTDIMSIVSEKREVGT